MQLYTVIFFGEDVKYESNPASYDVCMEVKNNWVKKFDWSKIKGSICIEEFKKK